MKKELSEMKTKYFVHLIDQQGSERVIVKADPEHYMGLEIQTSTFGGKPKYCLHLGKKATFKLIELLTELADVLPDEPDGTNYRGAVIR